MYIIDNKRYLALDLNYTPENTSKASYIKNEKELADHWTAHTRVSPIWPILSERKSSEHRDSLPESCYLLFAGPLNPAELDINYGPNFNSAFPNASAWISLGLLNVLIATPSHEELETLKSFFEEIDVIYEIWSINKGTISNFDFSSQINGQEYTLSSQTDQIGKTKFDTVSRKELELLTTGLTAQHRGDAYLPWIKNDINTLFEAYSDTVEEFRSDDGSIKPEHEADLVYVLANINSGLSRFTSQCLSGTVPIRHSECHYWPHSLLGTGLCNASLRNCINFVENTLGKYNIIERFKALETVQANPDKSKNPNIKDYKSINQDLLSTLDPLRNDEIIHPISYFSGRDNFKNDLFTVSVPLDTIGGLNSKKWSILTLTHELSHRFVEPIISLLSPIDPEDVICQRSNKPKHSRRSDPTNYLEIAKRDFLRCVIGYAASNGHNVDELMEKDPKCSWVAEFVKAYNRHIEEIFVHVFDFLYFYDRSAEKYIPDIWNSWGVLPQIETKLDEYIIRTAAALFSDKIVIDHPYELVRQEILDNLPLPEQNPAAHLDEVRARLKSDNYWQKELLPRFEAVELCARFVRLYIFSDTIMPALRGDQTNKSDGYDYQYSKLKIDSRAFENPLTFLKVYTRDLEPNETKSLWLYTMLSFALSNNEASAT